MFTTALGSTSGKEEPLSLRRLRDSLSCLERLDRQRVELRERSAMEVRSCSSTLIGGMDSDTNQAVHDLGASADSGNSQFLRRSSPQRARSAIGVGRCGPRERESAIHMALDRSQEWIDSLQRERDEALGQSVANEAEVVRLTLELEKSEATHRNIAEERQRDREELTRLRREHRDALEQLAALRAETHQSRTTSGEWRQRFEKIVDDQRNQISILEEASSRTSKQLAVHEARASEFGESLYMCIYERTTLLHFLVDILSALQSLFYEPTPFVSFQSAARQPSASRSGYGARNRSHSCEHRHSGCYACNHANNRQSSPYGAVRSQGRQDWREGLSDLQELITSLENEIGETSEQYTAQVHRIVDEAEHCAQVLRHCADIEVALGERPERRGVLQACIAWAGEERSRLEKLPSNALLPRIDWSEERAQYHAVTRGMESKFAQLVKLKRVLHVRQQGSRKHS